MKSSGKNIVIFFGSQTGTAEEFARRLAKNARLYGLKALVVDPEEIDLVFLLSLLISTFTDFILLFQKKKQNRKTYQNFRRYRTR